MELLSSSLRRFVVRSPTPTTLLLCRRVAVARRRNGFSRRLSRELQEARRSGREMVESKAAMDAELVDWSLVRRCFDVLVCLGILITTLV